MNAQDREVAEFAKEFFLRCLRDGKEPTVHYDQEFKNVKVWANGYKGGCTVEFICDRHVGPGKAAERVYTLITTQPKGATIQ